MDSIDRRRFLGAAGAAALLSTTGQLRGDEAASPISADPPRPPMVPLGKTGITMSRVGQGTGVNGWDRQSDQTRMGFAKFVRLIKHAYDRGITFFDLADLYGTHVYFREALKTMDRSKLTVLSKIWWRYDGPESGTSGAERKQATLSTFQRFLHETATDYLDVVLLHCLTSANWNREMEPYMEALNEEKEKGRIKVVGVSCHDLEALKIAVASPWVEVILARINPKGVLMDGGPDAVVPVLQQAKDNGKAIIGMKIFGAGQLSKEPEACVKYAQGLGLLDAMTIGFTKPEEVDSMLRMISQFPAKAMA